MKKINFNRGYQKIRFWLASTGLLLLSNAACADNLPAIKGATDWIVTTLISIAVTVLGLQIMFRLWQVNQGQKEWSEVAKPILITALIVSVPAIAAALTSILK